MDGQKIRNMEEFAAVSGISRPTVSKYFNDPASVRLSTRQRIEKALERYDYRPNIFAVNQNRRLTKNIGIVVPYLADPFFAEIARHLERRCIDAGFFPLVFSAHGERGIETDILDSLRSLKPAGVLMAPLGRASDRDRIGGFCDEVPTVLFDSNIDDIGAAFIGHDNAQSGALIVDYLCRTGAPPCFFEMPPLNPNANKRRTAYIGMMERLGYEPKVVRVPGDSWDFEEVGYSQGLRVIAEGLLPSDTVLCSNDRLAIGLLAAAYESGLKVGRDPDSDLRIAGQDDHPFSRYTCPSLTTIAQNYAAIAERSVETLFALIDERRSSGGRESILYEGHLVLRRSA